MIREIIEFAAIPGPTFAEEERRAWLERRLADVPGRIARDDTGNLVWRWGDEQPELLLLAHIDTVFPEGTPLRVKRVHRDLVGPGVGDNAAAVVVALTTVEELLRRWDRVAPGALVFTVGEEGLGNLKGAHAACASLPAAAVVAVEGHGLERVIVDGVGSVRACITVKGPGGHSWVDRGAPSCIHALLEIGARFVQLNSADAPVNIGIIDGGRAVNAIADSARLLVERRALDEARLTDLVEMATRLRVPDPLTVDVEILGCRPTGSLPRDSDLLRVVADVRRELRLPLVLDAGSTDANAALARGLPALTLGVAHGSGMHTLEERVDLESLGLGKRQLELLLERLLSPTKRHTEVS